MKLSCNVIADILPLYAENMVSKDTRILIDDHISTCDTCKKSLEELYSPVPMPKDTDVTSLKKLRRTLQRKKFQTIMLSVMITFIFSILILGYLTAPSYIPYETGVVSVQESSDGSLYLNFGDNVSGYKVEQPYLGEDSGYVYHITTWDSIWNRYVNKKSIPNVVLNPKGEEVSAVYYYMTNGSDDYLIYGNDQHTNGGIITLPRLILSYYAVLSMIMTMIISFILFVFRKNVKVKNTMTKMIFLPISYLLSQIIIKGFTFASYSPLRDVCLILLVMFPMYGVILLTLNYYKKYKIKM